MMPSAATREFRRWAASLALMLPAAIPYVAHWMDRRPNSQPTGYIQADMPLYMAKAREAFDSGRFGILYGNPCEGFSTEPRIYFQPWTFALGLIHWLTAIPPGVLFTCFWFVAAWSASRVFLAVFEQWVGLDGTSKKLALVVFFWGGGVLALVGAIRGLMNHGTIAWDDLSAFDPFRGWWFLNLGRNLVYPTEALYHALAFGSFLVGIRRGIRNLICALALAGLTASCSPFAGLETLAILWLAGLFELAFSTDRRMAAWFFIGVNGVGLLFASYYLIYLNGFPEHRALATRMMLPWRYSLCSALAAYGPVSFLALWRFRTWKRTRELWSHPQIRFLIAWAVAAFSLENHDFVFSPRQPIHFTRGYVWSALFLLGAPTLSSLFEGISKLRAPYYRLFRTVLIASLLADNLTWFALFAHDYKQPDRNGVRLKAEEREVLRRLGGDDLKDCLLLSEDERISYLALSETRLRSLIGHSLETPDYELRKRQLHNYFEKGELDSSWKGSPLVVVVDRLDGRSRLLERSLGHVVFQNRRFQILQNRNHFDGSNSNLDNH
jgi:hypothetical protein